MNEWIVIEDRLPRQCERVLVCMNNGDVYIGALHQVKDGLKWTLEPTSINYVYPAEMVYA